MIISFTGHRKISRDWAKSNIIEVLDRIQPESAIVGGAAGADTLAAEVCWQLGLPYLMALPHRGYAKHYRLNRSAQWSATVQRAERVVYVVEDKPWHFSANFKRNEYMVDNSHVLCSISTFDPYGLLPTKGGTAQCVRYARKVERQIEWART